MANDPTQREPFTLPVTPPGSGGVEVRRYGYWPEGHLNTPSWGRVDDWVILCTVVGAIGPFEAMRTVTCTPWTPDEQDPFQNEPLVCATCGKPAKKTIVHISRQTLVEIDRVLACDEHVQTEITLSTSGLSMVDFEIRPLPGGGLWQPADPLLVQRES